MSAEADIDQAQCQRRFPSNLTIRESNRETVSAAAFALISAALPAHAQSPSTEDLATKDLGRRAIERRAVEAVIWGMPAANTDLMLL
ncbi:MAG TPA: hypothetical protein VGG79_20715 [Roseiarcus sp.]